MAAAPQEELLDHQGWSIRATRKPISNASEIEAIQDACGGEDGVLRSPPEMLFGGSRVALLHRATGILLSFTAEAALKTVPLDADGPWGGAGPDEFRGSDGRGPLIRSKTSPADKKSAAERARDASTSLSVAHAGKWKASSDSAGSLEIFGFDWTFSPRYVGTLRRLDSEATESFNANWEELALGNPVGGADSGSGTATASQVAIETDTDEAIDVDRLMQPDPILFFHEAIFFEDELADSGSAELTLKMRVMPTCFLVLLRFYLRVDGVVFRSCETRFFHVFGTERVVREVTLRELPADKLEAKLRRQQERETRQRGRGSGGPRAPRKMGHLDPNEVVPLLRETLKFSDSVSLE
jgi:TIP41-like family